MTKKPNWDELQLKDDFMFTKVMQNEALCKEMLEKLLDIQIHHIKYLEEQKNIALTSNAKSVRLDVYVQDEELTVYNVEMQTTNKIELPKRSRYYQGMVDLNLIEKGESYKHLNRSYIIFICTFDLFGKGLHRYTFQNICMEHREMLLGDEAIKIFFNTKGTVNDVSNDIISFLKYFEGTESNDTFVQKLKQEVENVRKSEKWRRQYMTLFLRDQENFEQGLEQGIEQGLEQGRKITSIKLIRNLTKKQYTEEQIAELLELEITYVQKIQALLDKYEDLSNEELANKLIP